MVSATWVPCRYESGAGMPEALFWEPDTQPGRTNCRYKLMRGMNIPCESNGRFILFDEGVAKISWLQSLSAWSELYASGVN